MAEDKAAPTKADIEIQREVRKELLKEEYLKKKAEEDAKKEELALLKERALTMGINLPPNIGLETLKQKINEKLNPTIPQTEWEKRQDIKNKALKLIRVRITNMHPDKKNIPGEIITVYNRNVGRVSKYIPFGAEASAEGYHIPMIIYNYLKNKKFAHRTKKKGQLHPTTKLVPEYSLEVLPDLTREELKKLAQDQRTRQAVDTTDTTII